jgi:hypothetical protein
MFWRWGVGIEWESTWKEEENGNNRQLPNPFFELLFKL